MKISKCKFKDCSFNMEGECFNTQPIMITDQGLCWDAYISICEQNIEREKDGHKRSVKVGR